MMLMKPRWYPVFVAVVSFALSGLAATTETNRIPVDRLVNLRSGTSLDDVEQRLNTRLGHEFTTRVGTNNYRCMRFASIEPPATFYLLFGGSNLLRIIETTPFTRTNTTYRNTTWEKLLPVDPDKRIAATLQQPSLSAEEISQLLSKYAQLKAGARNSKNNLPGPVLFFTAPVWARLAPAAKAELKQVERWRAKYDPLHISLGATTDEVHKHFGDAAAKITRADGSIINLYGHRNPPNVAADTPEALVAVVFEDQKVATVLSHHFFSTDWYPLLPTSAGLAR